MALGIVTLNNKKYMEIKRKLNEYGIKVRQIPLITVEIQSTNMYEIVLNKVSHLMKTIQPPFIVEDSGLFIKSLNGFPGPYSSYVFKTLGNNGILKLMRGIKDRKAEFISLIGLALKHQVVKVFQGKVHGMISMEKRGSKGFGFDPIFIPEGYNMTFAEMDIQSKNKISHRGRACDKLANFLINYGIST